MEEANTKKQSWKQQMVMQLSEIPDLTPLSNRSCDNSFCSAVNKSNIPFRLWDLISHPNFQCCYNCLQERWSRQAKKSLKQSTSLIVGYTSVFWVLLSNIGRICCFPCSFVCWGHVLSEACFTYRSWKNICSASESWQEDGAPSEDHRPWSI